jgi:centrin-3
VLDGRFKEAERTEEIHSAFELFDVENKGYITMDDLRRISNELGENLDEDECRVFLINILL